MIGPSSSHTAGALRLGRTARRILGHPPIKADITFFGSFAETYRGHGTDLAIVAGLLDLDTDDMEIRNATALAEAAGMEVCFHTSKNPVSHPNTALLTLTDGKIEDRVMGISIGGGSIEIQEVNEFDVHFTAAFPTLLLFHDDRPGMLAQFTRILSLEEVNIGYMDVDRKSRNGDVLTVIEIDGCISPSLLDQIRSLSYVHRVSFVDLSEEEASCDSTH